ncbi:MAG: ribonuclease P [Asgard group archaeon]|nr:ribonuclease P [Asgard group archaeon]
MTSYKNRKQETKLIASERIHRLLTKADEVYPSSPSLAKELGSKARKIAMKAQISIPEKWRHRFCKNCKTFLYPGINAHVRIKHGKPSRRILYCHECTGGKNVQVLNNDKSNN